MEYIILAIALFFLILFFFAKGFYDYKRDEKRFREHLASDYGTALKREYKPEQLLHIPRYYEKHADEHSLDDITWHDLDMDEVFKQMNYTYSSAGEEYLYYILRNPEMKENRLENRENIIRYFKENPTQRVQYQFIFSKLGKIKKFSIYDYLDYLDDLGEQSNLPHYISWLLLVLSIVVMFFQFSVGLLCFLGVLIYNNFTYFKVKEKIEPYITSFAYIFRLMDTYERLKKYKVSALNCEFDEMAQANRVLQSFSRGSYILMSSGRMTGSGSPLDMFFDFIRMGFHIDIVKFNQMLRVVRGSLSEIDVLLTQFGKIEACIAIGEYREYLDTYCIPVFENKTVLSAKELYHPLITNPVKNSVSTNRSVLITGSNASGKSTFLKTVAINAILAQTIHTCLAEQYTSQFFYICSSMSLKDNVFQGESYYMVEIKSIKRILDKIAQQKIPVLCFVDEVLRGTNTIERIAASAQIMKSLNADNSICFVATHDVELTHLLEKEYDNYHFQEEVLENDITFSYQLQKGRATTRNAIKLLSIMGFQDTIVQKAENMAEEFIKTSKWQMLD